MIENPDDQSYSNETEEVGDYNTNQNQSKGMVVYPFLDIYKIIRIGSRFKKGPRISLTHLIGPKNGNTNGLPKSKMTKKVAQVSLCDENEGSKDDQSMQEEESDTEGR